MLYLKILVCSIFLLNSINLKAQKIFPFLKVNEKYVIVNDKKKLLNSSEFEYATLIDKYNKIFAKKNDTLFVFDSSGVVLFQSTFNYCNEDYAYNHDLKFNRKNKEGLYIYATNDSFACIYDRIDFISKDNFLFWNGKSSFIYNSTSKAKTIVPFEFSGYSPIPNKNLIIFYQNNEIGVFDFNFNKIIDFTNNEIKRESKYLIYIDNASQQNGSKEYKIYNYKGKLIHSGSYLNYEMLDSANVILQLPRTKVKNKPTKNKMDVAESCKSFWIKINLEATPNPKQLENTVYFKEDFYESEYNKCIHLYKQEKEFFVTFLFGDLFKLYRTYDKNHHEIYKIYDKNNQLKLQKMKSNFTTTINHLYFSNEKMTYKYSKNLILLDSFNYSLGIDNQLIHKDRYTVSVFNDAYDFNKKINICPEFRILEFKENYIFATTFDNKFGLLDYNCNIIVPFEFKSKYAYNDINYVDDLKKYFVFIKNKTISIFNLENLQLHKDLISFENESDIKLGLDYLTAKTKNGKTFYISLNGVIYKD